MKKLCLVLALVFQICVELTAQSKIDSLLFTDRVWALKKKALVLAYLQLTEAEKASFWPVYEGYHSAIRYLEMEYIHLHMQYLRQPHGSGEKLEELSDQILKNDLLLAKLRKTYFKRFKKALSAEQASSFMQFDHSWRQMMRAQIIENSDQALSHMYTKK
jgi:hypothetical protein